MSEQQISQEEKAILTKKYISQIDELIYTCQEYPSYFKKELRQFNLVKNRLINGYY